MDTARRAPRTKGIGAGERSLDDWIRGYHNDRASNTAVYQAFTELACEPSWLGAHWEWVEANGLGFGDRALYHMWRLVLENLSDRNGAVRCLEVSVLKGQVISLWSLIGVHGGFAVDVAALGPFAGNPRGLYRNGRSGRTFSKVSPISRDKPAATIYPANDSIDDCKRIFNEFGLDYCDVEMLRGVSSDPTILASLEARSFDLIYIDGDHSEASAQRDVTNFSPMVAPGGFLVMDDASLSLQMDVPYRGLPGPSKAADGLCERGFINVLNVCHNRVFRKT